MQLLLVNANRISDDHAQQTRAAARERDMRDPRSINRKLRCLSFLTVPIHLHQCRGQGRGHGGPIALGSGMLSGLRGT